MSHRWEKFEFTNCIIKHSIIERYSKMSFLWNVLCRKRYASVRTTFGTVSGPCATTDRLKRATDNENHAGIDISKDFSPMRRWFGLSVSIHPSVLMNPLSDAQIAPVRCMTGESEFSRHLCLNKSYYLFSGGFYPFTCGQLWASILARASSRMLRSSVERAWQSGI
jgi:hypothetical protein